MSFHTLYNTFYYFYKVKYKQSDPFFEAVFVISFSFALIINSSVHLILILFCKEINNKWGLLVWGLSYLYFKKYFRKNSDISAKIDAGKASRSEFNKWYAIIFFIFTWTYATLSAVLWDYLKGLC